MFHYAELVEKSANSSNCICLLEHFKCIMNERLPTDTVTQRMRTVYAATVPATVGGAVFGSGRAKKGVRPAPKPYPFFVT